jgi:uncharacterized protein YjbI with pentapeptide repeats
LLRAGACGIVNLYGPAGAGKTTAIEHLAEVFRDQPRLVLCDDNVSRKLPNIPEESLRIVSTRHRVTLALVWFQLAEWTDDDLIEYVAATHRGRVPSVMKRALASPDRELLDGLPETWRIALDVLAADETVPDIWAALRWHVGLELPDETTRQAARAISFSIVGRRNALGMPVQLESLDSRARRLVRHRCVQLALAAEFLVNELSSDNRGCLGQRLPGELLRHVSSLARSNARAVGSLRAMTRTDPAAAHPVAASVLHAMGIGWRPEPDSIPCLLGAQLDRAQWAGVNLPGCIAMAAHFAGANLASANLSSARLTDSDFSGACLRNAKLQDVRAQRANFAGADLSAADGVRAKFYHCKFERADLTRADLSHASLVMADLREAKLAEATLAGANLELAQIAGADFSGANLTSAKLPSLNLASACFEGAEFCEADLHNANLEYAEMPQAKFSAANLANACLTGSIMPGADFSRADLSNAGLADVQWEGADLRKANLTGASFHAGSTRSGLLASVVPCEGSRTGFYTDDFNDRDYKRPEEIRKANLCGADLRGATIERVDFYLVDLRGARYTRKQGKWLRKCGAILRG